MKRTHLKKWQFRTLLALACAFIIGGITLLLLLNGLIWFNNPSFEEYPDRGVDVSNYQGTIDWDVLEGQEIDFAFIKATEGSTFVDRQFAENWEQVLDTGIFAGAYHFFSYDSDGEAQAAHFIDTVPKLKGTLPPVVDVEFYGDKEKNLPEYEDVFRELKSMLDRLESHYGVKPIIYTTQKAYRLYISQGFEDYPLWIRNILTKPSLEDHRQWVFWQYSDHGILEGYNGEEKFIDLNVFRSTYDDLVLLLQ